MEEPAFHAVIWDMDGLLFDTERLSLLAFQRSARDLGLPLDSDHFGELIGRNPVGIRAKLAQLLGDQADVETLVRTAGRHYEEIIKEGPPAKRGAREAIAYLSEHGVPQAVATSSTYRLATSKLERHDLLRHLNALVTGDQVAEGKPHPEPYLLAAARLDTRPERCVAFEDSVNGILSAYQAGMKTVLIPDLSPHDETSLKRVWRRYDSLEAARPLLESIVADRAARERDQT